MNKNLAFLLSLEKTVQEKSDISLVNFIQDYKTEHSNFEILNSEVILIHLYGSIVLPWEKLKKKLPKKIMMADLDLEKWGAYQILNHNPSHPIQKMDLRFFLRKLRNAISHNNVKVTQDKSVIFRDQDGAKIKYEWNELLKLMETITHHSHP